MNTSLIRRLGQLTLLSRFKACSKSYYDQVQLGSNYTSFKVNQFMTQGQ